MAAPMKCTSLHRCKLCRRFIPPFIAQVRRSSSERKKEEWRAVVGLEIHAQIKTNSKLFSGADTGYAGVTNNHVSLFDAAFPGTLPVLNKRCVEAAVKTALALDCNINRVSTFDRKHYFYADLPTGYQITQQRKALANGGHLKCTVNPTTTKNPKIMDVKILQIQLEQDSGKSLHNEEENISLIDLNRAGVGLMEIITAPDMSDGDEAVAFVKELKMILETIDTCDGKMSEGSLRVDANISIHREGEPLGTRVEVKNLNSFRSVSKAINYEITRQKKLRAQGIEILNETKSFDIKLKETILMRDKEIEQDYRFMPEPNLPPLHVYDNESMPSSLDPSQCVNIDNIAQTMPVLPEQFRENLRQKYGFSIHLSSILVNEEGLFDYFNKVLAVTKESPVAVGQFLGGNYLALVRKQEKTVYECEIEPSRIAKIMKMKTEGRLSAMLITESPKISLPAANLNLEDDVSRQACAERSTERIKTNMSDSDVQDSKIHILEAVFENPDTSVEDLADKYDLWQTRDLEMVRKMCEQVIADNQNIANNAQKKGKKQMSYVNKLAAKAHGLVGGKGNRYIVLRTMKGLFNIDDGTLTDRRKRH